MDKITTKNAKINRLDLGLLQVTGEKAKAFLQGQLTCDVEEVDEKQTRLGAHCDAKGRVQATLRLFFHQNAYYCLLPRNMVASLATCLQKYAVFSKVKLSDVTQNWQVIELMGDVSQPLLAQHSLVPEQMNGLAHAESVLSLSIPGPMPRFILLAPTEAATFFTQSLEALPPNASCLLDIMAGIASIYPQTTAQFTPHQLNYPAIGGVSFSKGCYIGQEIIARTHYLGKTKSRLYRTAFETERAISPGTDIQDAAGTRQGIVIMSAQVQANHYQALVCLQSQAISHTISVESPQGPPLRLLELPTLLPG